MRTAVTIHVFHYSHWKELARCAKNLSVLGPDVFITVSSNLSDVQMEEIRSCLPSAKLQRIENRGFDVGPFVKVINELELGKYDLIVKLHTKRNRFGIVNHMPLFGGQWRKKLLSFCSSPKRVLRMVEIFHENPQVGMIGAGELIVKEDGFFIGGTMFAARASLFTNLRERVRFDDFEKTERNQTNSLAHAWERRLGYLTAEHGMEIHGFPPASPLFAITRPLRRFLYEIIAFFPRLLRKSYGAKHCI